MRRAIAPPGPRSSASDGGEDGWASAGMFGKYTGQDDLAKCPPATRQIFALVSDAGSRCLRQRTHWPEYPPPPEHRPRAERWLPVGWCLEADSMRTTLSGAALISVLRNPPGHRALL